MFIGIPALLLLGSPHENLIVIKYSRLSSHISKVVHSLNWKVASYLMYIFNCIMNVLWQKTNANAMQGKKKLKTGQFLL